jgi:hypothetical protein
MKYSSAVVINHVVPLRVEPVNTKVAIDTLVQWIPIEASGVIATAKRMRWPRVGER